MKDVLFMVKRLTDIRHTTRKLSSSNDDMFDNSLGVLLVDREEDTSGWLDVDGSIRTTLSVSRQLNNTVSVSMECTKRVGLLLSWGEWLVETSNRSFLKNRRWDMGCLCLSFNIFNFVRLLVSQMCMLGLVAISPVAASCPPLLTVRHDISHSCSVYHCCIDSLGK